ncbi:unnamed protein product, partial [marine sediment metagenome]
MKNLVKVLLFLILLAPGLYGQDVEQQSESTDMSEQETAAESISYSEKIYKKIEENLKSKDWKVRKSAVVSVPDANVENKIDLIRIVLTNDKKDEIRIAAIKALIKIGGAEVISPLTEALKDDKEYIRSTALGGLIKIGEEAADSIGSALNDSDEDIRKTAVEAIEVMKKNIALKYLDVALSDLSASIRERAINKIYDIYRSTPGGFNGP